jgi:hypothetical protein
MPTGKPLGITLYHSPLPLLLHLALAGDVSDLHRNVFDKPLLEVYKMQPGQLICVALFVQP